MKKTIIHSVHGNSYYLVVVTFLCDASNHETRLVLKPTYMLRSNFSQIVIRIHKLFGTFISYIYIYTLVKK